MPVYNVLDSLCHCVSVVCSSTTSVRPSLQPKRASSLCAALAGLAASWLARLVGTEIVGRCSCRLFNWKEMVPVQKQKHRKYNQSWQEGHDLAVLLFVQALACISLTLGW